MEHGIGFDWNNFANYGMAGLCLFVLLIVLWLNSRERKDVAKEHIAAGERWRLSFESATDRADHRQAETNMVLRDLTKATAERSAQVENMQQTIEKTVSKING